MPEAGYPNSFYGAMETAAEPSAAAITELLSRTFHPTSVVDVGCGTGAWLRAFHRLGVGTVLGIDWFDPDSVTLQIEPSEYRQFDLGRPLDLGRRYDLAICLEVGEHLSESSAGPLVDNLTRLSDAVVFSAAIPLQLGFHHINERWPSYWIEKFERRGFVTVDRLRFQFWNTPDVEYWYAQNMLVFLDSSSPRFTVLRTALENFPIPPGLPLVHPAIYLDRSRRLQSPLHRWALRTLERFPRLWSWASRNRREATRKAWEERGR